MQPGCSPLQPGCSVACLALHPSRQAESEQMALESEDNYLHSQWANPKALKNAFTGIGDVKGFAGQR